MNVPIGDIDLFVVEKGSGPPLLLVHGFPLDHTMWRYQVDALSASRRVIAPDLRGFGQSGVAGKKIVTMERFADDLAALLGSLDVHEPIDLCGLSMGGYIAWQFYHRHKSCLARLILCDTRADGDAEEVVRGRMIMAARVLEEGPGFIPDTMLPKLFAAETFQQRPDVVEETKEMILGNSGAGIAAAQLGMAQRPDMSHLLSEIDIPTLVLCGTHDVISPPSEMRVMAASIPGARFVEIPKAGHMAPMECPADVNEALLSFLSSTIA